MPKLEDIFHMEDPQERLKALLDYGRSLKVNVLKAKRPDGQYSENELAVLIHGAEQSRRTGALAKAGMLAVGIFLMAAVFAAIFLFTVMVKG